MVKSMTVHELKEKLDQGQEIVLIDCREQDEWDAGHIATAQLIPLSQFKAQFETLDTEAEIIIQCRSGRRSLQACMFLQSEGYENLANLEGGILAWEEENFPIEA